MDTKHVPQKTAVVFAYAIMCPRQMGSSDYRVQSHSTKVSLKYRQRQKSFLFVCVGVHVCACAYVCIHVCMCELCDEMF